MSVVKRFDINLYFDLGYTLRPSKKSRKKYMFKSFTSNYSLYQNFIAVAAIRYRTLFLYKIMILAVTT